MKIEEQVQEILKRFPGLKLSISENNMLISGRLNIDCEYLNEHIIDEYEIIIIIYDNYPERLPVIRETNKRIPLRYGHIYRDGELCLATDEEIKLTLGEDFTLNKWFDNFVMPYFFGYSYFEKYGVMPFGERSHGTKGIMEFYKDFFNVDSEEKAKNFLKFIYSFKSYKYKGHYMCPCGSGKRVRDCHRVILLKCEDEYVNKIILKSLINI